MELLNRAYIQAIIAYAGLNLRLENTPEFDYGIDGSFRGLRKFNGKIMDSPFTIEFQSKATTDWESSSDEDAIIYDIDATAYNKLVYNNNIKRAMPKILILFCLPKEQREWIHHTEECLKIYKCCYWELLKGEQTTNTRSVRIRIPRSQLLTPTHLNQMLKNLEEETW